MSKGLKYSLLLVLCSCIWGFAFSAQSLGAGYVGHFTFFFVRNIFAVLTMLIILLFKKSDFSKECLKKTIKWGIICGILECVASLSQQYGISLTTTAKASFITATYVLIVPIISTLLGQKHSKIVWLCVGVELIGLYLLCINGSFVINVGDLCMIACAFIFAVHIIFVDKATNEHIDIIVFNLIQFMTCALISGVGAFALERPFDFVAIKNALIPLLYTGVLSSAIGITLQVVCQKELDSTVASLIMCLESVFGAIGGWVILNEVLSLREMAGCALMFLAIVAVTACGKISKE